MSWYKQPLYSYVQPLKKYFDFEGRARRREFWTFEIVNYTIGTTIWFIADLQESYRLVFMFGSLLFSMFVLIPSLAVSVRRLHDSSHSGWWLLIGLIPFGIFVLFIFMLLVE